VYSCHQSILTVFVSILSLFLIFRWDSIFRFWLSMLSCVCVLCISTLSCCISACSLFIALPSCFVPIGIPILPYNCVFFHCLLLVSYHINHFDDFFHIGLYVSHLQKCFQSSCFFPHDAHGTHRAPVYSSRLASYFCRAA